MKKMVADTQQYLRFEYSDNPAGAKQLIEKKNLLAVDQTYTKDKLSNLTMKVELVERKIEKLKESYDDCFNGVVPKKRLTNQSQWYQEAITLLEPVRNDLVALRDDLEQTKTLLFNMFSGVDGCKKANKCNRSKKENRKKNIIRKENYQNTSAISFLNRITKTSLVNRCFPDGMKNTKISLYAIQRSDLKEDLKTHIRPVFDIKYISLLEEKTTFTPAALSHRKSERDNRFITSQKYATPSASAISELEITAGSSSSWSMYTPINMDRNDDTSSEEDNPFDFIEVSTP